MEDISLEELNQIEQDVEHEIEEESIETGIKMEGLHLPIDIDEEVVLE